MSTPVTNSAPTTAATNLPSSRPHTYNLCPRTSHYFFILMPLHFSIKCTFLRYTMCVFFSCFVPLLMCYVTIVRRITYIFACLLPHIIIRRIFTYILSCNSMCRFFFYPTCAVRRRRWRGPFLRISSFAASRHCKDVSSLCIFPCNVFFPYIGHSIFIFVYVHLLFIVVYK